MLDAVRTIRGICLQKLKTHKTTDTWAYALENMSLAQKCKGRDMGSPENLACQSFEFHSNTENVANETSTYLY